MRCSYCSKILIGLGIFGLINHYIERRFAEFVVTNKRVVFKLGFIRRDVVELQLNKAEAIAFQKPLGTYLRLWHHRCDNGRGNQCLQVR